MCARACVYTCAYGYECICVHIYVYAHVCICMYVCVYMHKCHQIKEHENYGIILLLWYTVGSTTTESETILTIDTAKLITTTGSMTTL